MDVLAKENQLIDIFEQARGVMTEIEVGHINTLFSEFNQLLENKEIAYCIECLGDIETILAAIKLV